jgi:hypothetical protein
MTCHCPACDPAWPRDPDAGFARGGDGVTRTSRLTDGRVLCALCMTYMWRCQLYVDDTDTAWDMCKPCGTAEAQQKARTTP